MDQDATWCRGRLGPGDIVLDGDSAPPRKGAQHPPLFKFTSTVAKRSPISATAELLYYLSYAAFEDCLKRLEIWRYFHAVEEAVAGGVGACVWAWERVRSH